MATHSKASKQGLLPSLIVNGLIAGMMLIFVLGGAYVGYVFFFTVKNAVARTAIPGLPSVDFALPLASALPLTGSAEDLPIILPIIRGGETGQTGLTGAPLPDYERKERVNILLMGIDKRPDEVFSRTDTMILVTVDPNTKTAGMVSIPRDLWVSIPGEGEWRVNQAHYFGDKHGYPGGGPALAMKTIQYNLGVPVQFFIKVDFEGFRNIVDTLGGIEIDIPHKSLNVQLSAEEIRKRIAELPQFEPKVKTGYLARYAQMVSSADTGAVFAR